MFVKTKSLLGLDIGSTMVKALEFTFDKNILMLTGYGSSPVASDENIEPAIREALKNGKISARRVATSISGRKVVVRYFPVEEGLDSAALRERVQQEAPNYIPFDLSQVEMDYSSVRMPDASGELTDKVILVAARSEEIETRVERLRRCGLIPDIIDIDTFALGNAFEIWADNTSVSLRNKVTGLVDIGSSKTTINIVQETMSNFSREVYIGSNDMISAIAKRFGQSESEAEQLLINPQENYDVIRDAIQTSLEDIGNEIRLSIDFYENQFETEVSEIFVSGGITRFPGLVELLGQIFSLPTNTWNPVENMEVGPNVDKAVLDADAPQLHIAVGLASRLRKAK